MQYGFGPVLYKMCVCKSPIQCTLTYPDTSVPKSTVRITEYESVSQYVIIIGSQACVWISE